MVKITNRLLVKNIEEFYGQREVIRNISMEINGGEVVGLLGPNGAGKTTTFYVVMG
jgi:lipopolysaccharide export system ATP-binding protein